ncbi:MAG: dienelactone hydrolase family protein [Pseudomonadaceae bacterium]|nr:dienelactone hydrolase family protein [Pseudomonadaceae bacterium]
MQELHVDIPRPDGQMNTFIVAPERHGPHPVVIFLMDAPGKREELHDMARRIASVGYYVLLPNLYYRRTREFVMAPDKREEMFGHMNALTNAMVCEDISALFEFAQADPKAADGPAGCVGYCMSGPFAFAAAAAFPERLAASASFHGVRLYNDAPDSPHLDAHKIKGEMYFGCAETDEWAPPEMVQGLDDYLAGTGMRYEVEWYPGTLHGFVFPLREGIYEKAAAERHWERLFALFARNGVRPAY